MNLVAKEFVASRDDEDGVLILSSFTGAARELTAALLVNPFSADQMADAMRHGADDAGGGAPEADAGAAESCEGA